MRSDYETVRKGNCNQDSNLSLPNKAQKGSKFKINKKQEVGVQYHQGYQSVNQ